MCTLCHETHENTTEASDHAPQVAEIFIGFSNSFFGKSITGASLADLEGGVHEAFYNVKI